MKIINNDRTDLLTPGDFKSTECQDGGALYIEKRDLSMTVVP